jgi:hypothetical protein
MQQQGVRAGANFLPRGSLLPNLTRTADTCMADDHSASSLFDMFVLVCLMDVMYHRLQ